MCLDIITTPKKLKSDGSGYKVFHKTKKGNIYLLFSGIGKQVSLPTGKWINEREYRKSRYKKKETILEGSQYAYPMGFHVYLNKELIDEYVCLSRDVIMSVKYRKAHTKGEQGGINVIVAKEIFIQKEV